MTLVIAFQALLALAVSYLLGSIPSGILVGRLWGRVDVRAYGSGRMGATNVLRILGWRAAAVVLGLDVAKGAAAMALGGLLGGVPAQVGAGIGVLAGHNWPLYAGFRGGRGVTPGIGAALVIVPVAALAGLLIAAAVIAISRYVSLGSLVGTIVCCGTIAALAFLGQEPLPFGPLALAAGSLITFQHRDNIVRLLRGTERRLGERA
ncbi:MAG: glycerol-3-phosphate 1-O-acyltransferase PlsY [Chloroflexi bacterium]|nr:glycerol-3-phosphate 1-O-acyltransferase PlsY [Chloroflexota bacterium]